MKLKLIYLNKRVLGGNIGKMVFRITNDWPFPFGDKLTTVHTPQFGFENIDATRVMIDMLAKGAGVKCSDDIIKEIETLVLLFVSITKSVDMIGVMSNIFMYVETKFETSVSKVIVNYIQNLFKPVAQAGFEYDEPDWLQFLKNTRSNWTMCKGNGLFDNFSKILSLLTIAGLAQASDLTFSIDRFKIIEPDIKILTASASDLASAVFDIVIFFTERCHQAWSLGSLRPFFSNDLETAELEVEYATICNYWELYKNGNLYKLYQVSEHDFYRRIENMGHKLKSMLPHLKGIDKRIVEDKFRMITRILGNFTMIKVNSGFKRSPFSIEYYGKSKVGKSTISEQVSHYLFTSAGLSVEEGRKYTHVSGKKHWDGARSDMLELKLDDHANTKAEFIESSPCDVIIKVCNNVPYSPPMADLSEKGKVWIEPELVSLTTNVEHLDAYRFSNNPYSVQRRMHYIVEVDVKDEYKDMQHGTSLGIDTGKVIASHTNEDGVYSPPTYHDVWNLTIKIVIAPPDETRSGNYVPFVYQSKELTNISMKEALNFLCDEFHKHREHQFKLEKNQKSNPVEEVCGVDDCKQIKGYCTKHLVEQYGFETVTNLFGNICSQTSTNICAATNNLLGDARRFYGEMDWVPYTPRWIVESKIFQLGYLFCRRNSFIETYTMYTKCNVAFSVLCWIMTLIHAKTVTSASVSIISSLFVSIIVQWWMIDFVRFAYLDQLRDRRILTPIQETWQRNVVSKTCKVAVTLSVMYAIAKFYKQWKKFNPQGSLEPKNQKDIDDRDNEIDVWADVSIRDLPLSETSRTVTTEQLQTIVEKNLLYGSIHMEGDNGRLNGLMLSSNVMLIPLHYFNEFGDVLNCTMRKKNPETSGGKFVTRLSRDSSYHVPGTDFCLCYTPNGGSFKNIVDYFPSDHMPRVPFRLVWRKKEGDILDAKGLTRPGVVRTYTSFVGGVYDNFTISTFAGLCGATLVSETVGSSIVGVHLGGRAGAPYGCYGSLIQSQLFEGFNELRKIDGVLLTGDAGVFRSTVMGVQILNQQPLHKKSPLHYMQEDSQVEYYGSCPGRSIFRSDVKVTPISHLLTEICGSPNIYRPPATNPEWLGWQDCLSNLSVPAHPYEHSLLSIAVRDYKEDLMPIFCNPLWNKAKPLNDHENLCGIPGKKFMDAIKLNTSVGYPLSGPKRRFVTELEPEKGKPNNRVLDQQLLDEIAYCEECYARGERAYPIAKACKKDEILSKPKCRIFYGNALSLTYLIRKYYLPILRVLQMNPLKSECAVGINSHGPEWQEFHEHVMKHGEDRLFGGDYGKYDQKLPAQLILAALRIMIDFARECDYTEKDIRIMEAMAGDIVYAVIAYNGDLIGLTEGTHISGNSLTVVINGICGSLNLRCFFYTQYPCENFESRMKFRDFVAAMTYGDDNIGSVSKDIDKFTIKECSKFLEKYGQVYTMPDKESELLDFLPIEEFEFLKRKSVYHPMLNNHIGALLDKSIYKSLHCFLRSKGSLDTEETAVAKNIDTALREWFNHGEEKYEKQRKLMKQVADAAGISHICTRLDVNYAQCVEEWREKYDKDYVKYGSTIPEFDDFEF